MIAKLVNSSQGQLEFLVDISVDEVMKELKTQLKKPSPISPEVGGINSSKSWIYSGNQFYNQSALWCWEILLGAPCDLGPLRHRLQSKPWGSWGARKVIWFYLSLTRVYGATRIVWVGGLFMDLPTGAIRNIDKTASKFLDSAKNCIKMICPEKCLATFCGKINSWPQCQPLINGCQLVKWLNKAPIS